MATHSSILAWEIPWAEEPGGLQSMGSQRVRPDGVTEKQQIGPGGTWHPWSLAESIQSCVISELTGLPCIFLDLPGYWGYWCPLTLSTVQLSHTVSSWLHSTVVPWGLWASGTPVGIKIWGHSSLIHSGRVELALCLCRVLIPRFAQLQLAEPAHTQCRLYLYTGMSVCICVYFTQAVKKHDICMCAHVYIYGDILMC